MSRQNNVLNELARIEGRIADCRAQQARGGVLADYMGNDWGEDVVRRELVDLVGYREGFLAALHMLGVREDNYQARVTRNGVPYDAATELWLL